jgi:hypothetical protein
MPSALAQSFTNTMQKIKGSTFDPVRDYDADPTGVTSSAEAFAAMAADVTARGLAGLKSLVVIPEGTFQLGTATTCRLLFGGGNVTVRGAGMARTRLLYTAIFRGDNTPQYSPTRGTCVFLGPGGPTASYNYTLSDFTIEDESDDDQTFGSSAVWAFYASDVDIRRVELVNCNGGNFTLLGGGPFGPEGRLLSRNLHLEDNWVHTTQTGISNAAAYNIGGWFGVKAIRNRSEGNIQRFGFEGGEMHYAQIQNNHDHRNFWDGSDFFGTDPGGLAAAHFENTAAWEGGDGMGNMAASNSIISDNVIELEAAGKWGIGMNSDGDTISAGVESQLERNIITGPSTCGGFKIQSSNGGALRNLTIRGNKVRGPLIFCGEFFFVPSGIFDVYENVHDLNGEANVGELVNFAMSGAPGAAIPSDCKLIRIANNKIINGHVNFTNNIQSPMGRIVNFNTWTNGLDARVRLEGNEIGNDIESATTFHIDGYTPDPDPRVEFALVVGTLAAGALSSARLLPVKGLMLGDTVTCVPEQNLPNGIQVVARVVDDSGTKKISWQVANFTNGSIAVPDGYYRFAVHRKSI